MVSISIAALATGLIPTFSISSLSSTLRNILANTDRSDLYTYPTDLTRDIIPKPIHSHNDYWRDLPFYTALSNGCISVEADVWLVNSSLLVGHEPSALTPSRTLQSLYLNPILDTLHRQNPSSPYVDSPTKNGVFDVDSGQTLYLFIDVKTPGEETWSAVLDALVELRQKGYLTTVIEETSRTSSTRNGPLTVIGTGNAPLENILSAPLPRDVFYDAFLPSLNESNSRITPSSSPIASVSFGSQFGILRNSNGNFNESQTALLRQQVSVAHALGVKVRYWDVPGWPISTRNGIWQTLWDEGVDFINADDLEGAAQMF